MENLSIELQVEILKRLTPTDRIICKLVCKTWLDILMNFSEFSVDRKLAFLNCFLHPNHEPVKVFLKSDRKYDSLKIGTKTRLHPSIKRYWNAIGANYIKILTLRLECLGNESDAGVYRLVKMLNSMINLETLILRKFSFETYRFFEVLREVKFYKVKHLVIECGFIDTGDAYGCGYEDGLFDLFVEALEKIVQVCQNLQTVSL